PENKQQLLTIKGVGEKKLEQYGESFLQTIQQYIKTTGQTHQTTSQSHAGNETIPSHLLTYQLFTKGHSCEEIATKRNLTVTTTENHLLQAYRDGYSVDWSYFFEEDIEQLILKKHAELAEQKLKPLKEALPDTITYTT